MKIIKRFIRKTERETLGYKILQNLYYQAGKFLNILNYIFAWNRLNKEIKKFSAPKIQIGSGFRMLGKKSEHFIDNYINTDIFGYYAIDARRNIRLPKNSLSTIFSSHVIEHLHQIEINKFLENSFRVLAPGGSFIVATPDLEKICKKLYYENNDSKQQMLNIHSKNIFDRKATPARIINCITHINYGHKFLLDFETFEDLASTKGFEKISPIVVDKLIDVDLKNYFHKKPDEYFVETSIWIAYKPIL